MLKILLCFVSMSPAHFYLFNFPWKVLSAMTIRMTFTLVDFTTLTVMIELSESAIPLVEFLVKLEN